MNSLLSPRRRSLIATAATALVIAALIPASPAFADDEEPVTSDASITGVVVDPAGVPAAETCIAADILDGGTWTPVQLDAEVRTDAAGAFALLDLADGVYAVSADSCAAPSDTVHTWAPSLSVQPAIIDGAVVDGIVVTDGVAASTADIQLLPALVTSTGAPTITGAPLVGSDLVADPGTWSVSGLHFAYQWLRDSTPIGGATSTTYAPTIDDVDAALAVQVTASRDGWGEAAATSAPTAVVPHLTITAGSPSITGAAKVGTTLTASAGAWSPATIVPTFAWLRNGDPIPGATGTSYTLTAADLGTKISVRATGSLAGYAAETRTSVVTAAVVAGTLATTTPVITGAVKVGSPLTVTPGWTPGAAYSYVWKRGTTVIAGATKSSYTPTATDLGAKLSVTVTGTLAGYTGVTRSSAATVAVAVGSFTAPVPTISGTIAVGRTVTAVPGTWKPSAAFTYQWKRGGVAIAGATRSTYAITATDLGTKLTVTVTGKATAVTTKSVTSASTTVAYGALTAPTPTISGTRAVGKSLTTVPGTWSPSGVTYTYAWKRAGVAITGATKSTYVLTASDLGKSITVTVTGRKAGYANTAKTSAGTALVTAGTLSGPTPTISGTRTVGKTLTAAPGTWAPSGVALTYQWKRAGVAISGATKSTYVLSAADLGNSISVTVTGKKTAYTTLAKNAGGTAKIAAGTISFAANLSGTQRAGSKLIASATSIAPGGTMVNYQWYRNGTAISGKTASTYTLGNVDAGKVVSVKITATKAGYTAKSGTLKTGTIANRAASFGGDGMFRVGIDVQPGTYYTSGTSTDYCYWERLSSGDGSFDSIIANDIGAGRRMITIASSDRFVNFSRCGSWIRYDGTGNPSSTMAGDGIAAVGTQVRAGTYVSRGNDYCYVASLTSASGEFEDLSANDYINSGTIYWTVSAGEFFQASSCNTFTWYSY
ncbi:hypothetical protein [Agromyces sp. Leaf222]|uniref:hypothetical protein n=1 Tax=Agromyces sp. Leaf222 TaxID=1735688 RepID=UPI0006F38A80|nr:hypothetical protein [Agromyces sp. Leaf222]KQM82111.1 hypothetical protein ASE68_01355 [Agromyces sp. Leaf222]